jgi:hypothetical protein
MKRTFTFSILLWATLLVASAQINIISPAPGDALPQNGQVSFWWSNGIPLQVSLWLERLTPDSGEVLETIPLVGKGYTREGVDYMFWDTYYTDRLKVGIYRLTVSGKAHSDDGNIEIYEADRTFRIIPAATMLCEDVGTGDWVSGKRTFRLSWDGLAPGTPYSALLLLTSDYIGEGYGFTLGSGTLTNSSGTIYLEADFPNESQSYYPPAPSIPVDGTYQVLFWETRTYLRTNSAPIEVAVSEARVRAIELKPAQALIHDRVLSLGFSVDTTYAASEIRTITLPIVASSEESNVFRCALYNKDGVRVSGIKMLRIGDKGYGSVSLTAHVRINRGSKKSFELKCIPMSGSGKTRFAIAREPLHATNGRGKPVSIGTLSYAGAEVEIIDLK